MRHNKLELYVHLVWTTWDRAPLIDETIERDLHRLIFGEAQKQNCEVLAIGGLDDHVHVLLSIPATLALSDVVKQLKGISSHAANHELGLAGSFRWSSAYAAFTVSRWDRKKIRDYVVNQRTRYGNGREIGELEPNEESGD